MIFGFEKEFEKLSSVFSTIQAVLQDAQEKQLKDKSIENWLQKLNSAAYEVDDILGECKNEAIIQELCLQGKPVHLMHTGKSGDQTQGSAE